MQNSILPILIFSPLVMALFILNPLYKNEDKRLHKSVRIFSLLHFIYTVVLFVFFDFTNTGTEYETVIKIFSSDWINTLGIKAGFNVDILSMIMIILTAFIFLISIFLSQETVKKNYQLYFSLILILESAILGIFCASDMFFFLFFWEMELIPLYILLLKWGSSNKQKTAAKFILYTFFGSIFILLGFLIVYLYNFINTGYLCADFCNIDISAMNEKLKYITFLFLFIGFGVKIPVVPFHSWLPDAHSQAVTPVSIILSSVMLKTGAYGILKFNAEMFNDTFIKFLPVIMLIAMINILYASCCAIVQKDLKRIIAYSGIIHMGVFLIAISSYNATGFSGGIFQLVSHALISAGLFIIAGIIYIKCGTKNILRLSGLGEKMPVFMFLAIPVILAAVSVPLTSGFVSEFLCFMGAFLAEPNEFYNVKAIVIIALISMILSSIYILKFFHGIFFSKILEKYKKIKDINIYQKTMLIILSLYIIYFGIFPGTILDVLSEYSIITFNLEGVF